MILDLSKYNKKDLKDIGYLLSKGFCPDKDGNWSKEEENISLLAYDYIIKDGICKFNFGYVDLFNISGHEYRNGQHFKELKSLKGFPLKCRDFRLNGYTIKDIDFLPESEEYYFYNSDIEKISYKFPKYVKKIHFRNNSISNFENFPEIVDHLSIYNEKITDLKGSPFIKESASLINLKKLIDISDLKGSFETIILENISIEEIPYLPDTIKEIKIVNCKKLKMVLGLKNIRNDAKVQIINCPKINIYQLFFESNKNVMYIAPPEEDPNYWFYRAAIQLKERNISDISLLEFEKIVLETIILAKYSNLKSIQFETKECRELMQNYIKSNSGITKFNL